VSDVPSILNPFRDTALNYRNKWFKGVLILPYKMKESPPLNFTGRSAPYPTVEQIEEWCSDGKKHNICIRLAGVSKTHELIGIDVDDYVKGDKKKNGGKQLADLEERLGKLPQTWISTARLDGVSGIRFFRVPRNLVFRGKADQDIEIIQKRHRYTVVWPSLHPEGGIYWWFPPGVAPNKEGKSVWGGDIPDARDFPELPDKWIDFLSSNRIVMPEDGLIDADSSVDEIYAWATDTFHGDDDTEMCSKMRKKLDGHLEKFAKASTFHDLLTNAHWNILNLAFEGHLGWNKAVNELEKEWAKNVAARGGTTVRDPSTINGEIFRSRIQALRQIKAKVDERQKIGATAIDASCQKTGECGSVGNVTDLGVTGAGSGDDDGSGVGPGLATGADGDDPLGDVPDRQLRGVPEYPLTDVGNAEHFADRCGNNVRYAEGYGWIVWHEGDVNNQPHWKRDKYGNQEIVWLWQRVIRAQEAYAEACYADYQNELQTAIAGGQPTGGANAPASLMAAKALSAKWNKWSERSGMERPINAAITLLKSRPGITIDMGVLDSNPLLLGVSNGVIELTDQVRLRRASKDDYITMNTGVPWEEPSTHAKNMWNEYLEYFLPDLETRRAAQIIAGYSLLGENPEKIMVIMKGSTNTGKSTFVNAIESALGDYAGPVNQSIFQNHKLNPVLANAMKKRWVVCSEFDGFDRLSASQFKRITGDSDNLEIEIKNSNETIRGNPHFVPALATNEVPEIRDADKALENRMIVIPFNVSSENSADRGKAKQISAICKTAILGWLVEGYIEYRRLGYLPQTKNMKETKQEFVAELSDTRQFAEDCLTIATKPYGEILVVALYERYRDWCKENGYTDYNIITKNKLAIELQKIGFKRSVNKRTIKGVKDRVWKGLKFKENQSNVISAANKFNPLDGLTT